MKYLMTFGKLNRQRRECVRNTFRHISGNDSLCLIVSDTDDPILKSCPVQTEILREDIALETALSEVENPDFWQIYAKRGVRFLSDFLRLWLACRKENLLYLDTDVWLRFLPEFHPGRPYLAECGTGADFFLFYTNDRPDWFRLMMERVEKTNPKSVFIPFLLSGGTILNEVSLMEKKHFQHRREKW